MRRISILVAAGVMAMPVGGWAQSQVLVNNPMLVVPNIRREARAAWVATVSNLDWPTSRGASTTTINAQRNEMNTILNTVQAMNMNMVFLQVRPSSDALYPSTLEPWSYFLTGRMGLAPGLSTYDPLQEWITAARSRGIQLYAWVNPYRVFVFNPDRTPPPGTGWNDTSTAASSTHIAPTHPYRKLPSLVRQYVTSSANDWWMDPGEPQTRTYVRQVVMDIVNRYDIDGLVIDDYFYPYPGTLNNQTVPFPDSATFALYGGGLSLANWRRQNVNNMIFELYSDIKQSKPHVIFGVSPFGIWQPGNPPGVVGLNSFADIYCDSKLWLNNGWLDMISPQLYWRISAPQQPYGPLLAWWSSQNTQGRHLWPSNGAYRILDTTPWPAQELVDQVQMTRDTAGATGNVFFRMGQLTANSGGLRTELTNQVYSAPALIPASPWLDSVPPQRPNLSVSVVSPNVSLAWSLNGAEAARWWQVSTLYGTTWTHRVLPASTSSLSVARASSGQSIRAVAVSAVDRMGNASPSATRVFDVRVLSPLFRAN